MTRRPILTAILLALLPAAGCIQHHAVTPEEMDCLWTLSPDPLEGTEHYRPEISGAKLPGRYIIRNEPSLIRSTISIVRAVEQVQEGAEVVDVSLSQEHADVLLSVLERTHAALEELNALATGSAAGDYADWADAMAGILAQFESIARLATAQGDGRSGTEPVGLSAAPLLEMLAVYLNERTGGELLGQLGPEGAHQARQVLAHLALRVGFAVAGRELPAGLQEEVTDRLRDAADPYAAEAGMAKLLEARVRQAGPSSGGDALASGLRSAMDAAQRGVRFLQHLIRQWDAVDRVEAALRRKGGQTIFEGALSVHDEREVRLPNVMPFQPAVAFRGTSRVAVLPGAPRTGEVVVCFEPGEDGGGVELRFEGIAYALARLLVLPIENARLREVRVLADLRKTGPGMIHAAVLLEVPGDKRDPRRLIVYKETRHQRVAREATSVRYPVTSKTRTFSYVTPARRYTYYSHDGQPQP